MLLIALAWAQSPLAIPATPDTSPPPPRATQPSKATSLATYRQRAVSVRRYSTYTSGGTSSFGWGISSYGGGSPYLGVATVISGPVYEIEHWAIFQGGRRLTVPEWMDTANAPEEREQLRKQLRRTKTWQHVLVGTAIVGGIGLVGTGVGSQTARNYDEAQNWRLGQLGASVALLGGIGGAFGTGVHTRTLRYDFDATQDLPLTQQRVRDHNAALRDELQLDPVDTARIDQGQ